MLADLPGLFPQAGGGEVRIACVGGRILSSEGLDLAFFDVEETKAVWLYVTGEEAPQQARDLRFVDLGRLLPGRFVTPHGYYLVDSRKVSAVSGAPGRFELHLEGRAETVPVTATYEESLAESLGVTRLDRLVPEHPEDRRLRELELYDFGARESLTLDSEDPQAVQDHQMRWDLKLWDSQRLLRYFGKVTKPEEFDEKKLVRNVVWQTYRWIQQGIQAPWNAALRQYWYMVERIFESQTDVVVEVQAKQYNDILNEMVHEDEIFRYREFGFFDVRSRFRDLGRVRPDILLVDEKVGNYMELLRAVPDLRYTIACTKGQSALIMLDYLAEELEAAGLDLAETHFHVFTVMDLDPAGRFIQSSFAEGMRARGLTNLHHYSLVRSDLIPQHFPFPILLEKARVVLARYTVEGGERVPYGETRPNALAAAWEFYERTGSRPELRTSEFQDGQEVWTLWKISAGSFNRNLINAEFHEAVARLERGEPAGIPEEPSWNLDLEEDLLLSWRPELALDLEDL